MKKNQKGFGSIEIILMILVLGLVSGIGWYVWQSKHKKTDSNNTAATEPVVSQTQSQASTKSSGYVPVIPEGWVKKTDTSSGITYAVNSEWPDETKITTYDISEEIPVGFGDPTHIKFNSTNNTWEAYDSGNKINIEVAKAQSVKVMGSLPTAAYTTGDGTGGQQRILFVSVKRIIQIELPPFSSITEGDKHANPYKDLVDDVIKSISVK